MAVKVAVISDIHYAGGPLEENGARRTAIADILLVRTVQRLNKYIKPDLTLILGDLIDNPIGPSAADEHRHLREIIDKLDSPVIIIPGNHDGDAEQFYEIYPRPEDILDINGARFVTFIDPEEPHYNARRADADIRRMEEARAGHIGPIVSLQHVPLFPPGISEAPYKYVNAGEIWSAFESNNYTFSISGHWHKGDNMIDRGTGRAVITPALCEAPFSFMEISIDEDRVETRTHELSLPRELNLFDYHVHTPFAYCQENMNNSITVALAQEFGLAGFAFTEHSGQLYFDRDTFWSASFMQQGINTMHGRDNRMQDYLAQAREFRPPAYPGFEIDCDYSGNPVIRDEDLAQVQIRMGSVHWLEELMKPEEERDIRRAGDEMLRRLSRFLPQSLHILAHPFRVFKRAKGEVPAEVVRKMIDLLRETGVAAEINFHNQITSPEFIKACVESGVKLVLGSDSHNLYEVGELYPHLELIRSCGYTDSDLPDILADIRPAGACALK